MKARGGGEAEAKRQAAALLGSFGGKARMAQMTEAERKAMQSRGGRMRAKRLNKARRREIARLAGEARWARVRKGRE
jgi:hypothetical protein